MGVGGAGRRFAVLFGEVVTLGRAAVTDELDNHGKNRDEHDDHDRDLNVFANGGERTPKGVTQQRDSSAPQDATDDIELHECPVVHVGNPGDDRGEGSDNRNESSEHDRLRPVLGEELLGAFDIGRFEQT